MGFKLGLGSNRIYERLIWIDIRYTRYSITIEYVYSPIAGINNKKSETFSVEVGLLDESNLRTKGE